MTKLTDEQFVKKLLAVFVDTTTPNVEISRNDLYRLLNILWDTEETLEACRHQIRLQMAKVEKLKKKLKK